VNNADRCSSVTPVIIFNVTINNFDGNLTKKTISVESDIFIFPWHPPFEPAKGCALSVGTVAQRDRLF
jgi:hypothetical protein